MLKKPDFRQLSSLQSQTSWIFGQRSPSASAMALSAPPNAAGITMSLARTCWSLYFCGSNGGQMQSFGKDLQMETNDIDKEKSCTRNRGQRGLNHIQNAGNRASSEKRKRPLKWNFISVQADTPLFLHARRRDLLAP